MSGGLALIRSRTRGLHSHEARPHPRRRHAVVMPVELCREHRMPQLGERAAAAPAPQPLFDRDRFQTPPVSYQLRTHDRGGQPAALDKREWLESQELDGGVHRMDGAVDIKRVLRLLKSELI